MALPFINGILRFDISVSLPHAVFVTVLFGGMFVFIVGAITTDLEEERQAMRLFEEWLAKAKPQAHAKDR